MMSWQRRSGALVAALVLMMPAVGISPAAAASPAHLSVTLGSRCMSGIKPSDDTLTVKLKRADGTVVDTYSDAAPSPFVYPCFSKRIRAGYRLRLIWAGHVREVSVPDLSIAADRVTDVVSGHGPASRHITVKFSDCSLTGCAGYTELDRIVDGHGRWHTDVTSILDLHGADRLAASYTNGAGDSFTTPEGHVPYLKLSKPNRIHVECQPDRAVTITLKTARGLLRASTSLARAGDCAAHDGTFRKQGAPVNIGVGNSIRSDLASDVKVVWPHLAVSWTGTAVSARCLPSAPAAVRVVRSGSQAFLLAGATDPGGHLDYGTTGFTSASGDVLELTCATASGDRVTFTDTVP